MARTIRVQGARAYLFQYTSVPLTESSVWQQLGSSSKTVLKNLSVGQRIWCKITAVGANDQVRYSKASLSKVVL